VPSPNQKSILGVEIFARTWLLLSLITKHSMLATLVVLVSKMSRHILIITLRVRHPKGGRSIFIGGHPKG
jgi:hypothetical protein